MTNRARDCTVFNWDDGFLYTAPVAKWALSTVRSIADNALFATLSRVVI